MCFLYKIAKELKLFVCLFFFCKKTDVTVRKSLFYVLVGMFEIWMNIIFVQSINLILERVQWHCFFFRNLQDLSPFSIYYRNFNAKDKSSEKTTYNTNINHLWFSLPLHNLNGIHFSSHSAFFSANSFL